jgi:hypothetical protein
VGYLPKQWKKANVKFLKKTGKPNYNNPSSYRPISLTNIIGKAFSKSINTASVNFSSLKPSTIDCVKFKRAFVVDL